MNLKAMIATEAVQHPHPPHPHPHPLLPLPPHLLQSLSAEFILNAQLNVILEAPPKDNTSSLNKEY